MIHINVYIGWLLFFFSFVVVVGNCFFRGKDQDLSIEHPAPANYSNNEKGTASIHIVLCITISVFYIIDIVIFIISFNSLATLHFTLHRLDSAQLG